MQRISMSASSRFSVAVLLLVGFFGSVALANFEVFGPGAEELAIFNTLTESERLEFAAPAESVQIVTITGAQQTAVAQEQSRIAVDCLPWLQRFPGGSIQWLSIFINEDGTPGGPLTEQNPPAVPGTIGEILTVGGEFNRWLNLTGVEVAGGARDPDRYIFMCEVCVGRGTQFEECHIANYTNLVIGSPPRIVSEPLNQCITRGDSFMLGCEVSMDIPTSVPPEQRSWTKDGMLIYSEDVSVDVFTMANPLFQGGVFDPDVIVAPDDGSIVYRTQFNNVTAPNVLQMEGVTEDQARDIIFDFALGTWECTLGNILGNTTVTSVIRECGPVPMIPDCAATFGSTVFPDSGAVLPPGCDVCIQEGSTITLDCSVSSGAPPITYNWTDANGMVVSTMARFTVNTPGMYMCRASNVDDIETTEASVLFFSPRAMLNVQIAGRTTNGCERLTLTPEARANLTADICIFMRETLDVDCTSDDDDALLELRLNDVPQENTSMSIVIGPSSMNAVYGCRVSNAQGPCGQFQFMSNVEVYDPARIDRVSDLLVDEIGAGRPVDRVQRANGSMVVLRCPTTGIPEETTRWYRVTEDSRGCFVETLISDLPDQDQLARHSEVSDTEGSTLTISPFTFQDEGTYVCRTENIAGNDADVVSLIIDPGSPEYHVIEQPGPPQCDRMCRLGRRNQTFICRNTRFLNTIPNIECDAINLGRPATSLSCSDVFPDACVDFPVWIPYPWGKCSRSCNQGHRERDVLCQIPSTGAVLPRYRCNHLPKPRAREFCGPNTCCVEDAEHYCGSYGSGLCNNIVYQRNCCWTCGLTEIP